MPSEDTVQSQFDSERLVRVEALAVTMDKKLFGNGQPGVIALMVLRMDASDKRIIALEKQRTQLIAGAVVAMFIFNFLSGSGLVSLKALLGK